MKRSILFSILLFTIVRSGFSQTLLAGTVTTNSSNEPIAGALISIKSSGLSIYTNEFGKFSIPVSAESVELEVSFLGFKKTQLTLQTPFPSDVQIRLEESSLHLSEINVVATGYQRLPRERMTGSFSNVDKKLFNDQVGTDILSRLPAIANSIVVDNATGGTPKMMLRGLSTIRGPKAILVVLDDFPYDGDINNINPNIVESVTILKDAAACSIWGARAANGVIVITTKKGQFDHPISIDFNSFFKLGASPNLSYIRQMSSTDFIDLETDLFHRGFYDSQINSPNKPMLSPVIDILNEQKKGHISPEIADRKISEWKGIDVRDQFMQHMYKPSFKQQYFVNAQGGASNFSWTSGIGYDKNIETLGNTYERINIRFQNNYRPLSNLAISSSLYYSHVTNRSGRYGYSDVNMKAGGVFTPYMQMVDHEGNAMAVPRNWNQRHIQTLGKGKLLDWNYYPLTDWRYNTNQNSVADLLANLTLNYRALKGLNAILNAQYEKQTGLNTTLADENSYLARDFINSYTQIDQDRATYPLPLGGILDKASSQLASLNLRGQLTFDNTYGNHRINAIGGMEIKATQIESFQNRYYGYNSQNLSTGNVDYTRTYPNLITGAGSLISNNQFLDGTSTRFVSQFVNLSYAYKARYIVSGSGRRDASNLFGLNTNDQWNPFWSTGIAWKISNEKFYKIDFLPEINLRATFGSSGNIDPAMVAVNTIRFLPGVSVFTSETMAQFDSYYNPSLKWETSKMWNLAADFQSRNGRVSGSIEFYTKNGINLFGIAPVDYSTGIPPSVLRNVANMKGHGWDAEIRSLNLNKAFRWNTILNFSLYKDKIVSYLVNRTLARDYISTSNVPISGIPGMPVYAIFAYKWAGLDPNTGEAQGYLNGEVSKNYASITGTGTKVEDLQYFGSAIPTKYGSIINSFSYKSIGVQLGISFKYSYYYRRNSINYTNLINNWDGHSDYEKRWKKAGDEAFTDVPVNLYTTNTNRDRFYEGAAVLVEKGDHIRLQYFNVTYDLKISDKAKSVIKSLRLQFNADNLGLIWRANKSGIDPDFNPISGKTLPPTSFSLGLSSNL
jgi:TonB-linked SusC/RagA family outer membrane protein